MEKLEDLELNALADSRLADGQATVRVSLDDL
jgi:antitoxin StbD